MSSEANTTTVNVNVPKDLLKELDDRWPGKHTSRTQFILAAIREKLDRRILDAVTSLAQTTQKIATTMADLEQRLQCLEKEQVKNG